MGNENRWVRGEVVAAAGTGINLGLGVLYAWSVLKGGIPDSWGWSNADKALPYSVACFVFSLAMVLAGRLQDRFGPGMVAMVGGGLVGVGCILAGMTAPSLAGFIIGFGVIGGMGIGFGYAATTPAAIKWFPPSRTGLVTGIVVAGFGLAPVYIAPLAYWLLGTYQTTNAAGVVEKGVAPTIVAFGMAFLVVVTLLAQLLKNPPPGHVIASQAGKPASKGIDMSFREVLATAQFYVLWFMYFCGAAAGLTFISVAQDLGKRTLGELAFLAVVVLAVGNATGRVVAGTVSDKLGRQWTMFAVFLLQAVVVFALYLLAQSNAAGEGAGTGPVFIAITLAVVLLLGANYGANLSLFPSTAKDVWGMKGFGLNYGLLFTAWGAAGLLMPWVNGQIKDATGSQDLTYFIIIGLMVLAAAMTFVSRALATRTLAAAKLAAGTAVPG